MVTKLLIKGIIPEDYIINEQGILVVLEQNGTVGTFNLNKNNDAYKLAYSSVQIPEAFHSISYLGNYIAYSYSQKNKNYI